MALDIMELRAYARAKDQLDYARKPEDEPTGPMADWVWIVIHELAQRRRREGD